MLEDAEKLIEIIGKVRELSGGALLRKTVLTLTIISCVLLLFLQNSFVSGMLGDMSETIKSLSFLALLLCVVSIPSVLFVNWLDDKYQRYKDEHDRKKAEATAQREIEALKEETLKKIAELGTREQEVLKYVYKQCEGVAWLPIEDRGVVKLYRRGILETMHSGYALIRVGAQCFLFQISDRMMEGLKVSVSEIQVWEAVPTPDELNVYQ